MVFLPSSLRSQPARNGQSGRARSSSQPSSSAPASTPVARVTARWSGLNPASASSPCAGRIAASATASRSASSSESPAASSGPPPTPGQHLGGRRRLGQRARHRVDLAALQRHRPAAGRAPAPRAPRPSRRAARRGRPRRRRTGRSPCAGSARRPRRGPQLGLDLGQRGAPGQPLPDRGRPVRVRHAVDQQLAAVARRSRTGRAARAAGPGPAAPGCGSWWARRWPAPAAPQGVDRGLGHERQRRPPVDLDAQQPGCLGVRHPQVEGGGGVDGGAVQVEADDGHRAASAATGRGGRPPVGAGGAAGEPRVDQADAAVGQLGHLLDRDAAALREQPHVGEVGGRGVRPGPAPATAPGAAAPGWSRRRRA